MQTSERRAAPGSERELMVRAEALAGRSVGALAAALGQPLPKSSVRGKGFVGQLVERALGADPMAGPRPDFPALGVELKTLPVGPQGAPLESTFCCGITMATADRAEWETSRLRRRLQCVLWLPVVGRRRTPVPDRVFGRARLWRPDPTQEALLQADWELLMGAIGAGWGGDVTAAAGAVLQVRPKAAHARVRTLAPGEAGPMRTLPLGFYLRASFTATLIR